MHVYMFLILSISLLTLTYDYINIDLKKMGNQTIIKSANVFLLSIISSILIFVAGFRFEVGADYWQYRLNYDNYVMNVWQSIKEFNEPGIRIVAYISSLFNSDYGGMFLIASILTVGLSLYTIYKSTNWLFVSVLLYIFIGSWQGSFNGVRQFIAVAILFYGHKYILEKNLLKYLLTVFLATIFHFSAVPMVLLYFVPQRKLKKKEIILTIIIAVVGLVSYDIIFNLISLFQETRGEIFFQTLYSLRQISILRVGIAAGPMFLYMLRSKKDIYDSKDYFYINMLLINMIIFIASYNSALLNRFSLYTNIYLTLGIPIILKGFKNKEKYGLTFLILIFYFIFWYVEVSNAPSLYNYNFIFNL